MLWGLKYIVYGRPNVLLRSKYLYMYIKYRDFKQFCVCRNVDYYNIFYC